MSNRNISNIKLGIFVTIAVVLFTAAVYYMGNRQHMFGSSITVSSVFEDVKGLKVGSNVRYAGISAGSVNHLAIINDSTIRVDMTIDNDIADFIKQNAIATITTNGLVGDMIINVSPGPGEGSIVKDRDIIASTSNRETGDMLNALGATTDNVALLTHNLIEITDDISKGEGSIATLLNNREMAQDLEIAISNLRITSENINSLSDQFQKSMDQMNSGEGLLGYLLTDTTFEDRVQMITYALDTLINHRTTPIIENMEASTAHILSTSSEIEELIADLDFDQGLAGVLFKDSLAAQDMKDMLHNLNDGTAKFDESMEALQHNFLLRGFFKKREKKRKKELERQQKELERQAKFSKDSN